MVGFCEQSNELSVPIKSAEFLDPISDYWFLKNSFHGVVSLRIRIL